MSRKIPASVRIPSIGKPVVEKTPPKFQVHKHLQEILARPQFAEIDKLRGFVDLTEEQDFLRDLRNEALRICGDISCFVEGLIDNPQYSLSWASSQFERVAALEVLYRGLSLLTDDFHNNAALAAKTVFERAKIWQAELTDQVMRAARSPSQSTSTTSNLSELMLTKAQANRVDSLNWFIRRMESKKS